MIETASTLPQHVSRVFVLPVATFDYLKRYQRAEVARTGRHINNSQVIAMILADHERLTGSTHKPSPMAQAAALLTPHRGTGR